ncbi:MAG: biotin/lipoate A/B protein ligase family protein [Nitrososphaerota archaeon]
MSKWRLIGLTSHDAFMNMAVDEALVHQVSQRKAPNTIRLYRWKPSAVSIGFFQSVEQEVNLEACKREGVDVVRRITGGGAVYHDYEGEVTYSLIAHQEDPIIPSDIKRSYEFICRAIVLGLERLGLKAEFRPVNDIVINGRKVSGNAQTRRMKAVLQHGTVLVDVDVKKMFSFLKVSDEKIKDKVIKNVEERVTSINRELGYKVSLKEVADSLAKGFEQSLGLGLVEGELDDEELSLAKRLRDEKYVTYEWNFKR